MNVQIQSFQMEYLQQVLRCWNENLIYDLINEERFTDMILLDDNFDPQLLKVAIVEDKIIAFCFGIKRNSLSRKRIRTNTWLDKYDCS